MLLAPGLAAYGSSTSNGPLRVGFSATSSSNRENSGAAYYGVKNLAGKRLGNGCRWI